jgi:septin family protein
MSLLFIVIETTVSLWQPLFSNARYCDSLARLDVLTLNTLKDAINIIPIIDNAHALTTHEKEALKSSIRSQFGHDFFFSPPIDPRQDQIASAEYKFIQVAF